MIYKVNLEVSDSKKITKELSDQKFLVYLSALTNQGKLHQLKSCSEDNSEYVIEPNC